MSQEINITTVSSKRQPCNVSTYMTDVSIHQYVKFRPKTKNCAR